MSNEIARGKMGLSTESFRTTAMGLVVVGEPTYDEWYEFGARLARVDGAIQWWIGDWAAAEGRVQNGVKSEAYDMLEEETGLDRNSVRRCKDVSESVDLALRSASLSWSHHKEIAPLEPSDQERWLQTAVDEGLTVAQLRRAIKAEKYVDPVLPEGEYSVIYADPPWEYRNSGFEMSAEKHYPTMSIEQLCSMQIPAADNAVCFMWATNPQLRDAMTALEAWGFEYKTNLVWVKNRHTAGFYVYGQHELCLIGVRGSGMTPTDEAKPKSVLHGDNAEHSRKPDDMYEIIERMYPAGRKLEIFARRTREGWEAFGNEV